MMGISLTSMFSIRTYLPLSIERITWSIWSSSPWISIVTVSSQLFFYPTGASVMIRRTPCTIAEPAPLHTVPENNMLPDHFTISARLFPVSRYVVQSDICSAPRERYRSMLGLFQSRHAHSSRPQPRSIVICASLFKSAFP